MNSDIGIIPLKQACEGNLNKSSLPRLPPFFLCLIYLFYSEPIFPQVNSAAMQEAVHQEHLSILVEDLSHFLKTGLGIAEALFEFNASNWRSAGLAVGSTALLFAADKTVRKTALSNQNDFNDHLFYFDHFYGDVYELGFTVALYGAGYVSGRKNIRMMGLHSIEAFLYAGAISSVFKVIAGRRRPYAGDRNLVFEPFNFENVYNSLPSGHATAAFAVSTIMAKSVDNTRWDIFWYGIAAMTGASRIYHNQHWVSDVFLGSVLGYSVASYIMNREQDSSEKHSAVSKFTISPYFAIGSAGIRMRF